MYSVRSVRSDHKMRSGSRQPIWTPSRPRTSTLSADYRPKLVPCRFPTGLLPVPEPAPNRPATRPTDPLRVPNKTHTRHLPSNHGPLTGPRTVQRTRHSRVPSLPEILDLGLSSPLKSRVPSLLGTRDSRLSSPPESRVPSPPGDSGLDSDLGGFLIYCNNT